MIRHEVVQRFYARVHDRYVDPGAPCPELDDETIARLVRAGCLRPVAEASPAPAPEPTPEPPGEDDGLDGLRVAELREIADKRGLTGLSGAKKADLIAALRADAAAGLDPEGE